MINLDIMIHINRNLCIIKVKVGNKMKKLKYFVLMMILMAKVNKVNAEYCL